jgi:hypothetical protein
MASDKGMASASRDGISREHAGWCLPASSDLLELAVQQHPTRGGSDGTVHRDGRPRRELYAGSDFRMGRKLRDFPVETHGQARAEKARSLGSASRTGSAAAQAEPRARSLHSRPPSQNGSRRPDQRICGDRGSASCAPTLWKAFCGRRSRRPDRCRRALSSADGGCGARPRDVLYPRPVGDRRETPLPTAARTPCARWARRADE